MSKPKLLISFSGGETSAFMTQWLWSNMQERYEMVVVFANTGEENEETLRFIEKCEDHFGFKCVWVERVTDPARGAGAKARIVDFETASRHGEPFRDMVAKYGIPNVQYRHCSRELKEYTIAAYLRSIGWGWKETYKAIGIRIDEVDRMAADRHTMRKIYPLISMMPMTKPDINKWWSKMPFRLALKGYQGNCKVCWKKSFRKLMTIAKENPSAFDVFESIERDFSDFTPMSRVRNAAPPYRFFRGNLTVAQIKEMAMAAFEPAIDDSTIIPEYRQANLFGRELDVSNGCEESCEAF